MPRTALQPDSAPSEAEENFQKYVASARDQNEVFGRELAFDEVTWDLTDSLGPVAGHRRTIRFTKWNAGHRSGWKVPMQEPVASFARAYVRNRWSQERTGALDAQLRALRALEEVCVAQGIDSFAQITGETLAAALRSIERKLKPAPAYTAGAELERIGAALSDHCLALVPINFRSWLQKAVDITEAVGVEFDKHRMSKLPSPAALRAIGLLYGLAVEPGDRVVADTLAILSSAPDRIGEALILPFDCEVEEEYDGKLIYGLRWLNKKGAPPTVKWVTGDMVSIVREAIGRLKAMSREARGISAWYEKNPTSLYLDAQHEHLRWKEWLTREEATEIIWNGPVARTVLNMLLVQNKVPKEVRPNAGGRSAIHVRFAELERFVVSKLPPGFPIYDRDYNLSFSDALYVFRADALHGNKTPWRSMVTRLTQSQINIRIQHGNSLRSKSVFERFELREEDGSPIKFNTHMLRHYLNTMAQHAGLNQLDIALWSGRKVVAQNETYEHVSTDRKLEQIRNLGSRPFEAPRPTGTGSFRSVRRSHSRMSRGFNVRPSI